MICSKCNSENTQRIEVIYSHGANYIKTRDSSTGIGFIRGGIGVGARKSITQGLMSSKLARIVSPPKKKNFKLPIFLIVIGLFLLSSPMGLNKALGGGGVLLSVILVYKNEKYNSNVLPGLYSIWQNSWLCNKCGEIYYYPPA